MDYFTSNFLLSFLFVFLSLILGVFLLIVPAENKKSNIFLSGYLLLTALDISYFFYDQLISLPPTIEMLRIRISAFKNPLLYFYLLNVIFADYKLKPKNLIHTLPFLLSVLVLMPNFFLADEKAKFSFLKNYNEMTEITFIRIFESGTTIVYLLAMVLLLRRFKKIILQNSSSQQHLHTYRWLLQFVIVIISLWSLTLLKEFFKFSNYVQLLNEVRTVVLFTGVGFISWFALKALLAPHLFRGFAYENSPGIEVSKVTPVKISSISDTKQNQVEILRQFMAEKEPYLNPALTIKDLANELDIPVRELSLLINKEIGQHFFDFINEYRIEKAKKLLADPQNGKATIQETLFDVGFNSKTPFNTAFKKHAGITPTQFKKALKSVTCKKQNVFY